MKEVLQLKNGLKRAAGLLCAALSACGDAGSAETVPDAGDAAPSAVSAAPDEAALRTPVEIDLTGATAIRLTGSSAEIDGSGAAASDGVITVNAGGTYAVSGTLDEGRIIVNAAGGADGSGFGGRGMGNAFDPTGSGHAITISGGSLTVTAGGDGLDANGTITMTGGTVLVSSTGSADGALDYDGACTLEGGVLLAASSGGMAQAPTDPAQYAVAVQFEEMLPAGTYVQLAGQEQEFVFCLPAQANHLVFSAPELMEGDVYSVSYGGEYSGESDGVLCTGGTYSGGTLLTELTISDSLTIYGQVGMGGSRGGNLIGEAGKHGSFGRNGMEDQGGMLPEFQGGMRPDFPDGAEDENMPGGSRGDRSGMEPPVP